MSKGEVSKKIIFSKNYKKQSELNKVNPLTLQS